jgi:23S rRNA-intervening sequence protein
MNSVEDLDVFKLAHQLTIKIYAATKTFPKEETYSLVDQMRRAADFNDLNRAPVLSAAKQSRRAAVEPFDSTQGRRFDRLEWLTITCCLPPHAFFLKTAARP